MGRQSQGGVRDRDAPHGAMALGYQPALDGLRALAVGSVIASHAVLWHAPGGWIGVDVFFTLSGFLITSILLEEWSLTGGIGLGRFYIRRFLRLTPPLVAFVATATATFYLFGTVGERDGVVNALPWVVLYMGNWGEALRIYFGPFGHLWSLAVEEQFYLLWAPVVLFALRTRHHVNAVMWFALAGVMGCSVARLYPLLVGGAARGGYGTDVRSDGIFLGCSLAVATARGWSGRGRFQRVVGLIGALALAALVRHASLPAGEVSGEVLFLSIGLSTVAVISCVVDQPRSVLARVLAVPPLVWVGERSYAIYLWHFAFIQWLGHRGGTPGQNFAFGLAGSVLAAHLSMIAIEGPLQNVRRRFGYREVWAHTLAVSGGDDPAAGDSPTPFLAGAATET